MSNTSLAAQAVANGPIAAGAGPTSFLGMDWLFVINLAMAGLGVLVFSFVGRETWRSWWRNRRVDKRGSAAELVERIMGLILTGATLRALSDALQLFGWDPTKRSPEGWGTFGRFLDPLGLALIIAGAVIWILTKAGLMGQLRTPPPFEPLWEDRDTKRRLCAFAVLAFLLALCPVVFRP